MKTTETQQKVYDFIEKFDNSTVEIIANGTGLNKLLIFKTIKGLSEGGLVKINTQHDPITYSVVINSSKGIKTKASSDNSDNTDEVKLKKEGGRDTGKLKFNGEMYGKGRLCLAVVKEYVKKHPKISITKLREVFPDTLQPRYGMIQEVSKAKKLSADRERFFLKPDDLIKIGDKKIAVCNQFGSGNLPLKHFKELGFVIK